MPIDSFFANFTPISFKKGDVLIEPSAEPSGIFFVKKGSVRQSVITPDGIELTMHFIMPGAFFPLFFALTNLPNRYTFQALTAVETCLAPKEQVANFLKENPDILLTVTQRLLFGIEGLLTRVESLTTDNAENKVLGILSYLAKHFGSENDSGTLITQPFTHQDIANLAGLTRETTSREIEKLNRNGIIKQEGHKIMLLKTPHAKLSR